MCWALSKTIKSAHFRKRKARAAFYGIQKEQPIWVSRFWLGIGRIFCVNGPASVTETVT